MEFDKKKEEKKNNDKKKEEKKNNDKKKEDDNTIYQRDLDNIEYGPYVPYFNEFNSLKYVNTEEWLTNTGCDMYTCKKNYKSICEMCNFKFCEEHIQHKHAMCQWGCDKYAIAYNRKTKMFTCREDHDYEVCDFYLCNLVATFYGRCEFHGDRERFK
jgi:hypothetical protein